MTNGSSKSAARDVILTLLTAAIIGLFTWMFQLSKWQGTIEERVLNIRSTIERVERKIDQLP